MSSKTMLDFDETMDEAENKNGFAACWYNLHYVTSPFAPSMLDNPGSTNFNVPHRVRARLS